MKSMTVKSGPVSLCFIMCSGFVSHCYSRCSYAPKTVAQTDVVGVAEHCDLFPNITSRDNTTAP